MKICFGRRHAAMVLMLGAGVALLASKAGANAPAGTYTITNNQTATGTVLDKRTGLTWQQMPATGLTWQQATTACANNTAGLPGSGWRLPTVNEVQTLIDDSQDGSSSFAIDPIAFPNSSNACYLWTSSIPAGSTQYVYELTYYGAIGVNVPTGTNCSRCVH